jgi:hypothetical protein
VARRTARRTARRQQFLFSDRGDEGGYDEPEPQAAPAQPDYTQELQDLAKLREQGILTDEEFEAKKKQILGI